jgi:hypothetical protein
VPLAIEELRVPLTDDQLAVRSWTWVLEDLPALGQMGTTLERQFLQYSAICCSSRWMMLWLHSKQTEH